MDTGQEVKELVQDIKRLGVAQDDGQYIVTFGTLFQDDKIQNTYEALGGTLKAAKRQKIVAYGPELLMQGMSDNVEITLIEPNHGE